MRHRCKIYIYILENIIHSIGYEKPIQHFIPYVDWQENRTCEPSVGGHALNVCHAETNQMGGVFIPRGVFL